MSYEQPAVKHLWFEGTLLYLALTDGRVITLPTAEIPWLQWLAHASTAERAGWSIEPGGDAVYWAVLDDGFEVAHALNFFVNDNCDG